MSSHIPGRERKQKQSRHVCSEHKRKLPGELQAAHARKKVARDRAHALECSTFSGFCASKEKKERKRADYVYHLQQIFEGLGFAVTTRLD